MSHIYYKFKSQKDSSRVVFDGPGMSVFDLKREIISLNKLGAGTDFDLSIYDESTNEGTCSTSGDTTNLVEYTDDNAIIPRATSIIVRRLPPLKPGKGNGAKYVSGSSTSGSRNPRSENFGKRNEITAKVGNPTNMTPAVVNPYHPIFADYKSASADDESSAIAMMMSAQNANWDSAQEKMAMMNPVYNKHKKIMTPVPDKPPPQGYICHRCSEKGHWIQACPTNDDPNFDNKPRIKRTTGIPKTFLKKTERPVFDDNDEGITNGVMIDADGEYVTVEPDSKSWATYQAKANAVNGDVYSQSLPPEHQDWKCQVCGKLAKDATRTPCCKKLFCDQCIQSALLESDFVCPSCDASEILLADLIIDEDVRGQISEYIKNWDDEKKITTQSEETNVSTFRRNLRANTQALSGPSLATGKRSRSPTAIDESDNKKQKSENSPSKSINLNSPPTDVSTYPNNPNQSFQQQQQYFDNMPPFMPGMPGIPGLPFPPDPFMMAAMGFPPMPGMMPGMMPPVDAQMYFQQGYAPQIENQMYSGNNGWRPPNGRGGHRAYRGNQGR
jgi:protein MPE1